MKRKMNKTCKWLAIGATLALASAFVVPAVFNESPVAIEETVNAETTYQSIDGVSIVPHINHITSANIGWHCNLLLQFTNGATTVTMDKTAEQGDFFTSATIDINGTVTSLKDSKFGFSSYEVVNHGNVYCNMIYAANNTWEDPAAGAMYTMTIPEGTIVYNCKFSQDVKLYFYEGVWHTNKMIVEGDEEYTMLQAATAAINPSYNHGTHTNGNNVLILHAWEEGKTVGLNLNYSYYKGNFNEQILLDGEPTDVIQFLASGGHSANGSSAIHLDYNVDWEKTTASYHTFTIPAGTTLYNIKFVNELNYYFFDGAWLTTKPVTDSEKVYTDTAKIVFEPSCNHVFYTVKNKMMLVIYSYTEENVATKLNFAYGLGNFNDNIYLTEYKDGQEGEQIKDKIWFTSGTHSINNSSPIHLEYDKDDTFWAVTTEKYYILTIPANTVLYNVKFQKEMKIYFYDGKWITEQPLTEDEMTFLEVDTLRINPSYNHVVYKDMNALILHGFSADDKRVSMVPDKVYPTGDFLSKVGVYDKNGQKVNVDFVLGTTMGHMGETSSAIHLAYPIDQNLWVKTLDTYLELRIEEGAKLFNFVTNKTFRYYFYNGAWMETKPVVDYTVNLDNLPTFTLGEVIEAKPSKFDKFVMGELGGENADVVAGSFSSPILNAKSYKLNFGMKILSDEYNFILTLNSSAADVWKGLVLGFQRTKGAGGWTQGVHYLDYLNVDGSFLGTGGDYFITDKGFEPNVEYDVTVTVALDENGLGVLMMLTVNGEEWGRLFVPPTGDYTIDEVMNSGFLLAVDNGDGSYYGTVEFTNKDKNAPTLKVKNSVIESGSLAEGYAYQVEVSDLLDGVVEYTAEVINGALVDGKFAENTTYTIRFTARDKAGNVMTKDQTFTVAYDVTAPVITVSDKVEDGTIKVTIGTTKAQLESLLGAQANDNKDGKVTVTYIFPEGMFDAEGKLTEGNFRVELKAKDASNNEMVLTIRVRAMEEEKTQTKSGGGCNGTLTLAGGSIALIATVGALLLTRKKED